MATPGPTGAQPADDASRRAVLSTYRIQLSPGFGLGELRRLVPYLARLGVSHVYVSPITRSRSGSTHGYDVVDPTTLDPELGGERDLERLVSTLRGHRMGLVLDVVPNHMATGDENPFWDDVLTHGRASRFAAWFDVDWGPPEAPRPRRVFLPVLGDRVGRVIDRGELRLVRRGGVPRLAYYDQTFPLHPATLEVRPLRRLVAAQAYRLAYWRRAEREVNYRRFFTLSHLVGVRVEDPDVFAATHRKVLEWIGRGLVDGLRIDHVDGLIDPLGYLERLREAVDRASPAAPLPVFVEKILARDEELPEEWPVAGTTGYDFLNEVEDCLVDARGFAAVERFYRAFSRRQRPFAEVARRAKRRVLERGLAADVRRLARRLAADAGLAAAIAETLACLGVYRTYLDRRGVHRPRDRGVLSEALAAARARAEPAALDRLGEALLVSGPRPAGAELERRVEFTRRLQQVGVAAAAKGVEDTAFYRWVPLLSRNEVGGEPDWPLDDAVAALHRANLRRARRWPASMLCASTHDTKRSADLRSRLDALSELPAEWQRRVRRWHRWNRRHRRRVGRRHVPDRNTEYHLYQALVGVWPAPPAAPGTVPEGLADRIAAYVEKAAREAKERTSWTEPDAGVEEALRSFVGALLSTPASTRFLTDLADLVRLVARPGMWNSLSRIAVAATAPGVPDTYRGDELWDLALVDPDNRRPVDFARRDRLLRQLAAAWEDAGERLALVDAMVRAPEDGRVKLHTLWRTLAARRADPELFTAGGYLPLEARGAAAGHVIAFARVVDRRWAITVAPRLTVPLGGSDAAPLGARWSDTAVLLPPALEARGGENVLTGEALDLAPRTGELPLSAALARFPVALLRSP